MARVLCTGVDRALLLTRRMLLEQAGHQVANAMAEEDVRRVCRRQTFDVVVIGQTVVAPEKERILRLVRELCPGVKVLELHQPYQGKILSDADGWLEAPSTIPQEFVQRVTELGESAPALRKRRQA